MVNMFIKGVSKTAAIIVAVIIIIAIIGGVAYYLYGRPAPTPTPTKAKIEKIVIGVIEPLTGKYAVFGKEAVDAMKLAVEHINAEGGIKSLGGAKLELVIEDAGEKPETAKLAAEKLISEHRPPIVTGAYISRLTAAIAEVTEREKVIFVIDALVDELTEKGWMYIFRAAPRASMHGASAVKFVLDVAKKKGIEVKTVVILNEDSIFGDYVAQGARREALKNGIKILDHITYPYDIADATPIVSKLMDLKPDFVVSVPYFHDAILIAKTMKEMGYVPMIVAGAGGCGYTDPDSIKAAGEAVEYFTNTYSYNPFRDTEWNKKFVNDFKARYGKIPTEAGGIAYYNMWIIKEALEKAGEMFPEDPLNPDNLRKAFLALDLTDENSPAAQVYPSGHIKFAPNGENLYELAVVLQVINGEPHVVWPEPEPGYEPIFPHPEWKPSS